MKRIRLRLRNNGFALVSVIVMGVFAIGTMMALFPFVLNAVQIESNGRNMNELRIAAETGAHMVKTYYCEDFNKLVKKVPIPVIIAGGKKIPERDALELAYKAIQAGATGVDMGRNIFQAQAPVAMIRAVRSIVHEGYSFKKAVALYESLKKT